MINVTLGNMKTIFTIKINKFYMPFIKSKVETLYQILLSVSCKATVWNDLINSALAKLEFIS